MAYNLIEESLDVVATWSIVVTWSFYGYIAILVTERARIAYPSETTDPQKQRRSDSVLSFLFWWILLPFLVWDIYRHPEEQE